MSQCCDTYIFVLRSKNFTYLRSHVVGCVAGRHQHPVVRSQLFRESEIADANRLRIPRVVRIQDVRRLEIPAMRNRIEERVQNFFCFYFFDGQVIFFAICVLEETGSSVTHSQIRSHPKIPPFLHFTSADIPPEPHMIVMRVDPSLDWGGCGGVAGGSGKGCIFYT